MQRCPRGVEAADLLQSFQRLLVQAAVVGRVANVEHFTCDLLVRGRVVHYDDYASKPMGAAHLVHKRAYEKAGPKKKWDAATNTHPAL